MKFINAILLFVIIFQIGLLSCRNRSTANQPDAGEISQNISDTLPWSIRMAETMMKDYPELWRMEDRREPKWGYTWGLVCKAFLTLWDHTGDPRYFNYARDYAGIMINENGRILGYKMTDYNIDKINSGKMLFVLYNETGDERYKMAIDTLRKQLKGQPRTEAGGFWHKKIYPWQMWLDGIYMGAPFYARYCLEYNEPENFDDVAQQILLIEEKTRDPETGLLYHAWDESRKQRWANPETGRSPNFWGRAMGWYSMALVDVLDYFPEEHPKRDDIIAVLQRLAEAIIHVQDNKTGLWYQVLDQGTREGNYLEGSVSSMFAYSLLKAVKMGYIDDHYKDNGLFAFRGITENLVTVEEDGRIVISPVCAVAGLGGDPYRDGSYEYYINERKRDNDPKAVGSFIMAALLYDELNQK